MIENTSFKKELEKDIYTFINVEEFSRLIWLDGVLLKAQISESTAEKSTRKGENYAGLFGDFIVIWFETSVYVKKRERLPHEGEWIYVNGKRFDVAKVSEWQGITRLELSAYRQGKLRNMAFGADDPYE